MVEEIAVGLIIAIVSLWLGSIEYRMKKLDSDSRDTMKRKEVSDLIDIKQEVGKALQSEIKEDIKALTVKLERLIEKT